MLFYPGRGCETLLVSHLGGIGACVSLGFTFLKQPLCGSASEDNKSTEEVKGMLFFFFQRGLIICVSSFTLCLLSSLGRGCFLSMFSVRHRDATGHWPAAAQPDTGSQITSLKPRTQTRTNCVWILSRLWDRRCLQPDLSFRKHILCWLFVQGNSQILKCMCTSVCSSLFLFSSQHKTLQKMESRPSRLLMLTAKQHDEQATKNILRTADEPQASFQRSCSPLEKDTGMGSMLPAQLGTRLKVCVCGGGGS